MPIEPSILTEGEKKNALNAVNLIKKKKDVSSKVITCADGRKLSTSLPFDTKILSPTVALEGLFVTLMIDVYEKRDVATFDVLGAFL